MPDRPLGRLGPVDGQSGEVAVAIAGMSYREENGERRFAYADFPRTSSTRFTTSWLRPD